MNHVVLSQTKGSQSPPLCFMIQKYYDPPPWRVWNARLSDCSHFK